MGKKKVKETESERLQRRQAKIFFDKGSAIKSTVGKDFVADMVRDNRGRQAATSSADSAAVGLAALKNRRKNPKVNVAAATTAGEMVGLRAENSSGLSKTQRLGGGGRGAANSATSAMNSVRLMTDYDHHGKMKQIERRAQRDQAIAGTLGSLASYKMESDFTKQAEMQEELKRKKRMEELKAIFGGTG